MNIIEQCTFVPFVVVDEGQMTSTGNEKQKVATIPGKDVDANQSQG